MNADAGPTNPTAFIEVAPQIYTTGGYVSLSLEGEGEQFMSRQFQRPYFENKQFV